MGNLPTDFCNGDTLVKVFSDIPNDCWPLNRLIVLLQTNQVARLAFQQARDASILGSATLPAIPNAQFHIGQGNDFNALACHIVPVTDYVDDDGKDAQIIRASMLVSIESMTTPYNGFVISKSYLTAFHAILDTFFKKSPSRFMTGWPSLANPAVPTTFQRLPSIEGRILKHSVVDSSTFLQRPIGWIPTLEIEIKVSSNNY